MELQEYCPSCGAQMERGACRYCSAPPVLLYGETIIWLEWCDQAGVKLARIKRVTKQEGKKE